MFDTLSDKLSRTFKNLRGQGRLTEDNIKDSMRQVRIALLEADVALPVATQFIDTVREKALGQEVLTSIKPGEQLIQIVHDELIQVMGESAVPLKLETEPPVVILMAGLQGSGKTTTSAKLAKWLHDNDQKKVMLVSTDVYRPAAIQQLETLSKQINATFFPSDPSQKPAKIAKDALTTAQKEYVDVVIIDTAGRLHIDDEMMAEIRELHVLSKPAETLFVVDSMTGQDAANTAKAFNDALELTGVVLAKTDGDARGGAALSVKNITGKPIKFIGTGEKIDGLEAFHPDRIASRILGMGDVLTLLEDAQKKVDEKKARKIAKKIKKGKGFDLEDFQEQLQQMKNMGGIGSMLGKIPGMSNIPEAAKGQINDDMFKQMEAIICSMTPKEKRFPELLKKQGSRKKRVAEGSGTTIQEVNKLLKQHAMMQKMMKKMKGGGMMKMMKGMKGMMPPGGGFPPME